MDFRTTRVHGATPMANTDDRYAGKMVSQGALYVLMGIEMILNAANINFVAFNRFGAGGIDGQVMAVFVIILAAAEAAVALAIVLNVFHLFSSVKPSEADFLRE
jgi:NADH-quinone oxidoreductase subunit K